jgi:hypothetical protein
VCFPFFPSRGSQHVHTALGLLGPDRVLLTDGYAAYKKYANKIGLAHAQCWVHCRRMFVEALEADPQAVEEALDQIAVLYKIEDQIRENNLAGEAKRQHRLTHSKPGVDAFFDWVERQFDRQGLLPSSPCTKALNYARERRAGLEIFLEDPDVPMDTNHLERALRVIPMGRKNWVIFLDRTRCQACWNRTEPNYHLPPARYRSLYLPNRCSSACRPAPSGASRRVDPASLETALLNKPAALGLIRLHYASPCPLGVSPRHRPSS